MTTQPPATLLNRFAAADTAVSSFFHRHNPVPYSLFLLLELSGDFRLFFPLVLSLYFSPVRLPFPPRSSLRDLLLGLILDIAVVGLVKIVFRRSRPSYNHSSSMSVAVHADNFSFPSGHASRVFLVATAIQLSASEIGGFSQLAGTAPGPVSGIWGRALLGIWAWAFATAASRVLLGRHYLCDIDDGHATSVWNLSSLSLDLHQHGLLDILVFGEWDILDFLHNLHSWLGMLRKAFSFLGKLTSEFKFSASLLNHLENTAMLSSPYGVMGVGCLADHRKFSSPCRWMESTQDFSMVQALTAIPIIQCLNNETQSKPFPSPIYLSLSEEPFGFTTPAC
ncbi:hypothetical protein MLD38_038893 [Melastoma candidum]|uniref:Uncharacterized protein n=1 Tax=Melastoma candidum TaxID=119954 RepID=A0ACB9L122_9MYRT|nr:hypothetical protein MLD38_038893 [Melastoma candidum]